MDQVLKLLSVTGAVFITATLVWNINSRITRIPFEPYIDRFGFRVYIPLFTSLVISIVIIMMMGFLQK